MLCLGSSFIIDEGDDGGLQLTPFVLEFDRNTKCIHQHTDLAQYMERAPSGVDPIDPFAQVLNITLPKLPVWAL